MKPTLKNALISALLLLSVPGVYAQRLPNKQEAGLWAPVNLKIDGKATEWNNRFQAFNHAVEIYYTIANDDKNLYLTIQATNRTIINRIINGGISFTVAKSAKKDKDAITVTYPVFERNSRPSLNINKTFFEQSSTNVTVPDSIVIMNNRRLEEKSKLIMVTGIKGVDTLISVYNDNDIKVAEKFDTKMAYTYELGISLVHLGLSTINPIKFNYHIVLNGTSILPEKTPDKLLKLLQISSDVDGLIAAKLGMEAQATSPTDFWGEYTLVKK